MSTISSSGTLNYASGTFSYTGTITSPITWPITITNTSALTVTFGTDLTLTTNQDYFIINGDDVTIEGNNKTVTITTAGNDYIGLVKNGDISTVGKLNCKIQNIAVVNNETDDISACIAQDYFGKVASGTSTSSITNCSATTSYGTDSYQGAIAGQYNYASITNCYANVVGTIYSVSGGIAGESNGGAITNCYAIVGGSIVGGGGGGIAAAVNGASITNCYTVVGGSITNAGGGIAGILNGAAITNCYTVVGGSITNAGGIVAGRNTGTITNCYAIVGGDLQNGAGIAGYTNSGDITNCYAILAGSFNASTQYPTQFSGGIAVNNNSGDITNCYVIVGGSISSGGGIVGTNGTVISNTGVISSSYVNYYSIGASGYVYADNLPAGSVGNGSSGPTTPLYPSWTTEGASYLLTGWTNYQANTPYILSAFATAVTSSGTVSTNSGSLALTTYGASLANGRVTSSEGGVWKWKVSSSGIDYVVPSGTKSYPLNIYAYNLLSDLTTPFTFTYDDVIERAYNVTPIGSANTIVPYEYSTSSNVTITYVDDVICFLEGTEIETERGYVKVEELEECDYVVTSRKELKKVYKVGKQEMTNVGIEERIKNQLYICENESYKELTKDLILTGCHSILVDKLTEEEREGIKEVLGTIYVMEGKYRLPVCVDNRSKVYKEKGIKQIYHVVVEDENEMESYGIYANGLLVESCSKWCFDKMF